MKVPGDLKSMELRFKQVWNFDEIGFNTNEKWQKLFILTSGVSQIKYGRLKLDRGYHICVHYYGQCFIPHNHTSRK